MTPYASEVTSPREFLDWKCRKL
ncbi:unnamed protein product [Calypogeia fissa]